ncbi:hypothetical protein [Neobacillus drentensis]|uniref:hypothetical protein n=1 Tax=Neobacillus drentensis TaxID=220684 RepID=UPI002FFDE3AD
MTSGYGWWQHESSAGKNLFMSAAATFILDVNVPAFFLTLFGVGIDVVCFSTIRVCSGECDFIIRKAVKT